MSNTTHISRRSLLASASLVAAAPLVLSGAAGGLAAFNNVHAAEAGDKSLRAVHRFNLGSMRISVIDDARFYVSSACLCGKPDTGQDCRLPAAIWPFRRRGQSAYASDTG